MPFPVIRPATLGDLTVLRLLYADLLHEQALTYPRYTPAEFAAGLTDFTATLATRLRGDPSLLCWVAETEEGVVSFLLGDLMQNDRGDPAIYALVRWIYTAPGFRRRGLAGTVLSAAVMAAGLAGATSIELTSKAGDPQWLNRGWVPILVTYQLPVPLAATSMAPSPTINGTSITETSDEGAA